MLETSEMDNSLDWKIDAHLEALQTPESSSCERAWEICASEMVLIAKRTIFKTRLPVDDEVVTSLSRDVLAEMWLQIVKNKKRFSSGEQFRAYLVGIARYLVLGLKKEHRKSEARHESAADTLGKIEAPEINFEEMENVNYLEKSLSLLPSPCKELITDRYLNNVTQQELVPKYGIPLGSMTSKTMSCLNELKGIYDKLVVLEEAKGNER